jgi:hypothetical protein
MVKNRVTPASMTKKIDRLHSEVGHLENVQEEASPLYDAMIPTIVERAFRGDVS